MKQTIWEFVLEKFKDDSCRIAHVLLFFGHINLQLIEKATENTANSLGLLDWLDDEETLCYKDVTLTMNCRRNMVSEKLALAQH